MLSAVKLYFLYGIHPGSCTWFILKGNKEEALSRAHPHIKRVFDELYNNLRLVCTNVVCEYENWKGYKNAPQEIKDIIEFEAHTITLEWIREFVLYDEVEI